MESNSIQIVTFNLRCVWQGCDGINDFIHRAGMVYDKIMHELPDVILFQEMIAPHLTLLRRMLPEYAFYGHFRDSDYNGEGVFTAVRRDRMEMLGMDSYWLSPTPYVPGSRYENQSVCPRTCLTVVVRDTQTGARIRTLNTHLDHISDEARILGIRQILARLKEDSAKDGLPFVLAGDFNATPDSDTIRFCNTYTALPMTDVTAEIPVTFHDWGRAAEKIDYIYVPQAMHDAVQSVAAWTDETNGIYLSDHYPVAMVLDAAQISAKRLDKRKRIPAPITHDRRFNKAIPEND